MLCAALCLALAAPTQEAPPIDELLRATPSGLCVVVGAGDGRTAAALADGGRRLVHVLEADEARVLAARTLLETKKFTGVATVEHWAGSGLPYPENLVNLLIAETPVAEADVLRVLAPNGAALVKRDGAWKTLRKPRPSNFGDWTHWRNGADGNMVSADLAVGVPTGLRWVAGPAQDAGGKKWYYDHILVSAGGRNFYDYDEQIVARDAYNGVLLWTRPIKAPVFKERASRCLPIRRRR